MEIYLDNAATTKPLINKAFEDHISNGWYNPSAAYSSAANVFIKMKKTRALISEIIGFEGDVVFTSGGTEANNIAILSAARKNAHYITSAIEHPCVFEVFKYLETLGAKVDYVKPKDFCINPSDVAALVKDNTALVSIMHVNNETGALNDIKTIATAVKAKNIKTMVHSDGVQAFFKTSVNLSNSDVDYYTLSAHKINALKGTGAVAAGRNSRMKKLQHGGEQENSFRPGTENTLGIFAFHEALIRGRDSFEDSITKVNSLSAQLLDGLESIDEACVNLPDKKVPHIVNVSFAGIGAEVLLRTLGEKGIYIGTGAACSHGKISRVLLESGVDKSAAQGAVRISFNAMNTKQEIDIFLDEANKAVKQLRRFNRR